MSKEKKSVRHTFYYEGQRYERRGKTYEEAVEKAAELKAALKRGEIGVSSSMSVKAWATEWLETYKRPSVGEGQYKNYLTHINNVILPAIGTRRLKEVKDIELQKILNSRTGKSKSDLEKLRRTLKAIFKKAQQSKLISHNPAECLELPKSKDGTHRSITDAEREAILAAADTHHGGLWVRTLLYCGLRPGETRALDWRHVDLHNKIIHVQKAMKAGTSEIKEPKSPAGVRDVPIPDALLPHLQAAQANPFAPVFTQATTGRRHTKTSMEFMWRNFKRELDISMGAKVYRNQITISAVAPDLVPYCLRHTYCTDLQDAGVPINVAKYLMGHSDISLTAKIYTHTTDDAISDALGKINTRHQIKENSKEKPGKVCAETR